MIVDEVTLLGGLELWNYGGYETTNQKMSGSLPAAAPQNCRPSSCLRATKCVGVSPPWDPVSQRKRYRGASELLVVNNHS